MKNVFGLILFILLFPKYGISQKECKICSVSIRVIENNSDRTPIQNAKVYIEELGNHKLTNSDGFADFPADFKEGTKISIEVTRTGYKLETRSIPINSNPQNNNVDVRLTKTDSVSIYGSVKNKKKQDIVNVDIELNIGSYTKTTKTDTNGNFIFLAHPNSMKSNTIEIEVEHPEYKSKEVPPKVKDPNEQEVKFPVIILKKKIDLKLTGLIGLESTGLALVGVGTAKFFNAKKIHDEYEMYTKEDEFLTNQSGFKGEKFNSRAEAYKKAEGLRISSRDIINVGGGIIIATGIAYFIIDKCEDKKKKNAQSNLVPNYQNGYTGLKLTYNF